MKEKQVLLKECNQKNQRRRKTQASADPGGREGSTKAQDEKG